MSSNQTMPSGPAADRGTVMMAPVERLIFFSDAAVAIALTLLILPLMDAVGEAAKDHHTVAEYLQNNANALGAFALSFVLIARYWRSHHRLFAGVEREVPGLFWLNMAWLMAVVLLPVATASTGALPTDAVQLSVYIGLMIAIAALLTAMTMLLQRHPEAWAEGAVLPAEKVNNSLLLTVMLIVALILAVTIPGLNYWALLVLLASRPVGLLRDRLRRRRTS